MRLYSLFKNDTTIYKSGLNIYYSCICETNINY